MHPNAELIERFYASFARRDHAGMIACYAPDVVFRDPVFSLAGPEAGAMWHMLAQNAREFSLSYDRISADGTVGAAHWEARYLFSGSGRRVHNVIEARFRFRDGLIVEHEDRFDFWRWSRQALGPLGLWLGWSPVVRRQVRARAAAGLAGFIAAHPEYRPPVP